MKENLRIERKTNVDVSKWEFLKNQHLLLDTSFIAKLVQEFDNDHFNDLLFLFKELNTKALISDFIKFEFFRGCKTSEHVQKKERALENLSYAQLSLDSTLFDDIINIGNIYSNKGIQTTQISLTDCSNSAYFKKYIGRLFLVTTDLNDYPLILHNRVAVQAIDVIKEVVTFGFYAFDLEAYNKISIREYATNSR